MDQDPIAHGFLAEPATTPEIQASYASDVTDHGYVMNLSHVWAQAPATHDTLFGLLADAVELGGLTFRQRGILIAAMASTMGDSYCSLAWGNRLAKAAGSEVAGAVIRHDDEPLDDADRALAVWARTITRDPNATSGADLEPLRAAGFDDRQIFGITLFVPLRRAFSTVNAALGSQPDRQLRDNAPEEVSDGVSYGRPSADTLS
jgi:alkylhydroperoxidase family enzyme